MNEPKIPLRSDGMSDLNNWREYVENCGYKTLNELQQAYRNSTNEAENILLEKAIWAKRYEITGRLVKILLAEELSTNEAISLLRLTKQQILNSRFNP